MASEANTSKAERGQEIQSLLAVDCGSVFTRAVLVEMVEGNYRLVACGEALTRAAREDNLVAGVRQAIGRVADITGRAFLDDRGFPVVPERQDGTGVDAVVLTLSAPPPLRVWLAGLVEEQSLASGYRACQGPYVEVDDVLSLVDPDRVDDVAGLAAALQASRPEAVFLVGGSEQGAQRPIRKGAEALALAALALGEPARPVLLYAGNSQLQGLVKDVAGPALPVQVTENVRPSPDEERLGPAQGALEALYLERRMAWDPTLEELREWSEQPVQTAARALGHTVRYLAEQGEMNVLALDLGARTTTVAAQLHGTFIQSSSPGLGMAGWRGSDGVVSPARLTRWLPEALEEGAIEDVVANLAAQPATMGMTKPERMVEQALARELLEQALGRAGLHPGLDWDLVIGAGGYLGHLPEPGQVALTLLDAVQPVGVSVLAVDSTFLGPAVGAMATCAPLAAAQVVEQDAFPKLGTAVCLTGAGREGDLALGVTVEYQDGEVLEVEVKAGTLEVIPLPAGERAELTLRLGRGFGLGQRGRTLRVEADGGLLGVVADARGRPLRLPAEPEARRQQVQKWHWALGA